MNNILPTYQDFQEAIEADKKEIFILDAINNYIASPEYKIKQRNLNYYMRKNEKILKRMSFLKKIGINIDVTFHRLCNGLFQKFSKQVIFYTIGNGLTLEKDKRKILGRKFNKQLIQSCINAYWGSISWNFMKFVKVGLYELRVFDSLEAFGLFDEKDGTAKTVIRFLLPNGDGKPMWVELYELEGMTEYKVVRGKIEEAEPITPYVTKSDGDILGATITPGDNYPTFPIIPLYANMLHQAEFTDAFKAQSDALDFVDSDLVDTVTQDDGIYGTIKNYSGDDARELVIEIKKWKTIIDAENADATLSSVEAPYQGKEAVKDGLRRDMYNEFMALDTKELTGGSLTNVAINVAKTDLDLKADELEWQVADVVENILEIVGIEYEEITFKRRTISNDTEVINNISTQIADGILDVEEAIFLSPNILEDRKKALQDRIELANTGVPPDDTEVDEDADTTSADITEEAEQVTGKTLTGIQTTSLIGVIEKLKAGTLTTGQAINIVAISIGVSKEEAKRIIEGLD